MGKNDGEPHQKGPNDEKQDKTFSTHSESFNRYDGKVKN
jgi:hypothetical protein